MKTIRKKRLQKITLLLAMLLIVTISCQKAERGAANEFTIQGTSYNTPNAYLLIDDGPTVFTDGFALVFSEGTMRKDNINGISTSTDTHHAIALFVMHGGTVNSEQAIGISNATYTLDDDTSALTNITNYTSTYTYNSIIYGDPDDASANEYIVNNGTGGNVIINSININYTTRSGTIDCSYNFLDANNVRVIGNFSGAFEIISGL